MALKVPASISPEDHLKKRSQWSQEEFAADFKGAEFHPKESRDLEKEPKPELYIYVFLNMAVSKQLLSGRCNLAKGRRWEDAVVINHTRIKGI